MCVCEEEDEEEEEEEKEEVVVLKGEGVSLFFIGDDYD